MQVVLLLIIIKNINMIIIKTSYFLLILIVSNEDFVEAQQNPVIRYISKEKVFNIGDTVNLRCSVKYAENYTVNWIKLNLENPNYNILISSGTVIKVPDPRFSVRYDNASKTYNLKITKIQEILAGRYQCEIITGINNKIIANVFVHVRIAPYITDNSTRSVIVPIGNNVALQCYAYGYPPPRISWRKRNSDSLPNGGVTYYGNTFSIFNISKNDRGTYYCLAENEVAIGVHRSIRIEVIFAPLVEIEHYCYGQALQHDMELRCRIESFPPPSIVWYKDRVRIHDNQHYQISIFPTDDEFTETVLNVMRIEKKQYGNYTCEAFNKIGQGYANMQLYEIPHPTCSPTWDSVYSAGSVSKGIISNSLILTLLFILLY